MGILSDFWIFELLNTTISKTEDYLLWQRCQSGIVAATRDTAWLKLQSCAVSLLFQLVSTVPTLGNWLMTWWGNVAFAVLTFSLPLSVPSICYSAICCSLFWSSIGVVSSFPMEHLTWSLLFSLWTSGPSMGCDSYHYYQFQLVLMN